MKKLLIVIGAVIVVVILALVVAPYFISADTLKGQILARVHDATGRDVTIAGPLRLALFPDVKVEATDVTLANAPGASTPAMAKLKQLNVAVKLIPLISGRVQIDKLSLIDPVINLEIDAKGRPNWNLGTAAAPAPPAATTPATPPSVVGLAALSNLRVAQVSIENGEIVMVDRRSNESQELKQVTVTLSAPSLDAPFTLDGSAVYRGEKIALSVKLDNTRALVRTNGKSGLAASIESKPVTLKFTGNVSGGGDPNGLAFAGNIDLAVPSVRGLIKWSGQNLALPKDGFGALALSGAVEAKGGVAKFSQANFSLDAIKAKGALTVDTSGARPALSGTLQTGLLDFNPYLGPPSAGGGGGGWSRDPFDPGLLRQVDARLTVDADGVHYRKLQIGKSALSVDLKGGKLVLDVKQLALYRGQATARVNLDATQATAAMNIDSTVSGVDVGALLRDAGGGGSINGTGNFTLKGNARGNSQYDMIRTLQGSSSFRVNGGTLAGVDLGSMLKNTTSAFHGGGGGVTTLRSASADYTIRDGIMSTRNLAVSTSAIDASGSGTVNLPSRTVNMRIEPKLVAGIITVPVIVSGPWDHLSYEPDVTGIAKGLVKTPGRVIEGAAGGVGNVGKGLGQGVGDVGKGVGGALKSLFGN